MTFMFGEKRADSTKIAVIDCQTSGVAGDILLGALLDAGADVDKVVSAIKHLESPTGNYSNVEIAINQVMRGEFKATQIDITAKAIAKMNGQQLIEIVEKITNKLQLSEKAKQFASNTIRSLVNAEAELHGNKLTDAHLHEVGLIDTPAEIIGVAVALENLGLFEGKIYATPVAVGGGTIKFSHGIVPCPAPATLAILESRNYPIKGGPIEEELATPTGAAILVNMADEVSRFYPPMTPLKVGYGAGTKEFAQMPNCLRITIGKSTEERLLEEEITVLETNLDDVTGEIVGYSIDKLLAEGAKDVCIIPIFTKKNRPGQILRVVAAKKDSEHLSQIIMEETGTLGVRILTCERHVLNRELHQVDILINESKERVNIKVVKDKKGTVIHIKPEYEDLKRIAEKNHKPLREIAEIATAKAREIFLKR
jgi:pyridinium-3,5-bisthiocarboxylic acid mononucleotide nickel chelatase